MISVHHKVNPPSAIGQRLLSRMENPLTLAMEANVSDLVWTVEESVGLSN